MKTLNNAKLNSLLLAMAMWSGADRALAQGTAFTYQGQLSLSGAPANGSYDFAFGLYNAPSLGTLVGSPVTNRAVPVAEGLFTTVIDFGAPPWSGQALYLEILVRTNGNGTFTALNPLQQITPSPYAITASNLTGTVSAGQLSGTLPISQVGGILPFSQLPNGVLTNRESGITLSGSFTGNGGSLTNIPLTGLETGGTLSLSSNGFGLVVTSNITVGLDPFLVIPATNLNGLGRVDLVTPNYGDNTLSVLTNTGAGGFATSATIPVGSSPYCVAVAELNNDGKPDLADVNYGSGSVTILFNTGEGRFTSNQTVAVGANPTYIAAVSNLSGVGKTGLVVANEGDGTITVLTNNGSGIMTSNATLAAGANAFGIAVADFNGDGKPDLAVSIFGGNTLIIYTNTGLGTFVSNATLTVGSVPEPVLAVDVNNDGWIDLICGNRNDNTLSVLTNNHGVFSVASTVTGVGSVRVLAVGDFNNDGRPDLACGADVNSIQIVFNTGNGTFAPGPSFEAAAPGIQLRGVAVLDINGDGQPDLVSCTYNDNFVVEMINESGLPSTALMLQDGALRLVPGWNGVPDLVAGSVSNLVDASISGSVIAGGGSLSNFNHISADDSSISGGEGNTIAAGGDHSAIGGGFGNTNAGEYSFLGGGFENVIQPGSPFSVLGGGYQNQIVSGANYAVTGGGYQNTNAAPGGFIGGGYQNEIFGSASYGGISAGAYNFESGYYSFIAGGFANELNGALAFIGGGLYNTNDAYGGAVVSGYGNYCSFDAQDSFIGGGTFNVANGNGAFIGGGGFDGNTNLGNNASGEASVIAGGLANTNSGNYSTIPGGVSNLVNADFAMAAGQQAQAMHQGAFVWADSQNAPFTSAANDQFLIRAAGGVGIDTANTVENSLTVNTNIYLDDHPVYFRGRSGLDHNHGLAYSGSGVTNFSPSVLPDGPVLWGYGGGALGVVNTGPKAVLNWNASGVGINANAPNGPSLVAQGGQTGGFGSPVVLFQNTNTGVNGPALRVVNGAGTNNYGALCVSANVTPGSANGLIASFGNADAFVTWITNDGTIYAKGVALTSDRNAKENFTPVDHRGVLAKVLTLPVTEWNYKGDAAAKKHIGPVAQDFQSAFGLDGEDNKHISVVDESGVALAAIQGLNQKVDEKEARIQEQDCRIQNQAAEITDLKEELTRLKQLVTSLDRKFTESGK